MLQTSVLAFYAHNLIDKKDLDRIRKIFEEIDDNGDGMLSLKEIQDVMHKSGKKNNEIEHIFSLLNYQKNDMISYEEFIQAMMNRDQLQIKENIKKCFNAIDIDNNGCISIMELKKISYLNQTVVEEIKFKELFYHYSNGKHFVRLTSSLIQTS